MPETAARYRIEVHADAHARLKAMGDDVLRGLTARPRSLPPKYFYDATGSRLFDAITRLPEYYPTRVEATLIEGLAPSIMRSLVPADVVELGSGFSVKTRRFLAARASGRRLRYVPVDVDEAALDAAAHRLLETDADLEVHAVVGDFERHLVHVPPRRGRRLVLFLGSTIGNLDPPERQALLAQIGDLMAPGDRLLLGVDLVKDVAVLEAAYNDAAGVTASFNRNILRVVNRTLGGNFRPSTFRHHAWYNREASRIEMHLIADRPQRVRISSLDLAVDFAAGEGIWTESSYKFTRAASQSMLEAAGLTLEEWNTDPGQRFALIQATPAGRARAIGAG